MKILILAGSGVGGTEKAAYMFGGELARRGHKVFAQGSQCQPRGSDFLNAGGEFISFSFTTEALTSLIRNHRFDVIHQHVSGYSDQSELYNALDQLGSYRPKLVETNVFGHLLDFHDHGHVDFRMFVSLTSGLQAFRRARIRGVRLDPQRHSVLSNPMEHEEFPLRDEKVEAFRKSLGVEKNECLAIRIGRPGHKWCLWECEAFAKARKQNPKLRLLLMEPDAPIANAIRDGKYGSGIIVKEATSDQDLLKIIYRAADLMLHSSNFGESFGYTLAEAMMARIPIITRATPWGDNAQTELVGHNVTGMVCCSVHGMSEALVELSMSEELREKMGSAAHEKIRNLTSLKQESDLLEDVLAYLGGVPQSNRMQTRFEKWKGYMEKGYEDSANRFFEKEKKLLGFWLGGKAYGAYRSLALVKRYMVLKKRGNPVSPPKLFG